MDTKEITKRLSIKEIAAAYADAKRLLVEGCAALTEATQRLEVAFGGNTNYRNGFSWDHGIRYKGCSFENPDSFEKYMRREAWRTIVGILEIKKISSIKRCEEIDKQLDSGELPEITEKTLAEMLSQNLNNMSDTLKELVREVFDWLRPSPDSYITQGYKTHQKNTFVLQQSHILVWAVERRYNNRSYRVIYRKEDKIRALDAVMHILDGKPLPTEHWGKLYTAIENSKDGVGETDYFEFRCYKNKNLHIKFKRQDLLDELNRIGSGGEPQLKKA